MASVSSAVKASLRSVPAQKDLSSADAIISARVGLSLCSVPVVSPRKSPRTAAAIYAARGKSSAVDFAVRAEGRSSSMMAV